MRIVQFVSHRSANSSKWPVKSPAARKSNGGANSNKPQARIQPQVLILFHSLLTVAIYIIMIEGLGKGVKYSLFVANAIIFMGGVIVFSIGVWTLNDRSFMERLLGTNLYVASAAILIVTGSIVAIISFLGTFGAYKEVKCMLLTYFVILVILFIVMITAGILGYVFRLEVDERMQQEMHSTIKLYGNDTQVTQAWDAVQTHFQCCGITVRPSRGYELWRKENAHFKTESGPVVPESCCRSQEDDPSRKSCQGKQPRREDTFYDGCYERMKEFVKSHALLVGGMAIGVSCLIIFGVILSCALYMMIKMAKIIYYAGLDYDKLPTSKRKIIEIQIDDDDDDDYCEPEPKRPSFNESKPKQYSLDEPKPYRPSFEEPKFELPPFAPLEPKRPPQIAHVRPRQPPSQDLLLSTLKRYFNFDSFRENQLEAVNATCAGHDTLILMPTGGGKSICYQLPAIISQGITVVVSPLKSLIADQVERMRKLDVKTSALFGETSDIDAENIIWDLRQECPEHKLLFVTPEKISASGSLMSIFQRLHDRDQLARFVIDEAHCVSMWGSDFRPDYRKLNKLREQFPSVPIMALTATAPPKVRDDILAQLKMDKSLSKVFIQSFNRPNLKFEVRNKVKGCLNEISKLIKANFAKQCGIIYCLSRNDCESVAAGLREQAISSAPYHAGLPDTQRQKVFTAWSKGTFQVVCATIAFGMGIDKSDVRFVIHYSMPKSIEGYYQEAGRAGRDGKFASCILYFSKSDLYRMKSMLSKTGFGRKVQDKAQDLGNLQHMIDYVDNRNECRRSIMLRYLGEEFDSKECISHINTACDNCRLRYNR